MRAFNSLIAKDVLCLSSHIMWESSSAIITPYNVGHNIPYT